MKMVLATMLSVFLLCSCGGYAPEPEEVVGAWVMSKESASRLEISANSPVSTIRFYENGSFDAASIPRGLLGIPEADGYASVSGSGAWKLDDDGGRKNLVLEFRDFQGAGTVSAPYATVMYARYAGKELQLYYYEGDPDDGVLLFYRKN